MAKKNYKICLEQESNFITFAVVPDVTASLQLSMALHQSSNQPHTIKVYEDGEEIVKIISENAE